MSAPPKSSRCPDRHRSSPATSCSILLACERADDAVSCQAGRCRDFRPSSQRCQGLISGTRAGCGARSMGNINASVDFRTEGEVAVVTADNPPVNALKHEVRAGLAAALAAGARRCRSQGGRHRLRRAHLLRRRRHHRIRQAAAGAGIARGDRGARGDAEAGRRGLARDRARRRLRGGAGLPFPGGGGERAGRPA